MAIAQRQFALRERVLDASAGDWSPVARQLKRALDVIGALLGMLCLGLLLPFVALVVRLDSPGAIIIRQTRLGQGGQVFLMYKFRTMVNSAESVGAARWATPGDPRVTRAGRFLRRSRLDEMPQFWNVLRGDMSLVGPRPERPNLAVWLEQEIPGFNTRLAVPPGLTGWAQVNYGYASTPTEAAVKLQYDLDYIQHRTFWLDLKVLLRTVVVMLSFSGV